MIDRRKLIQLLNKKGVLFSLRDEFTTTQSAPLAGTRTCEPGPGTLTISDSGNKLSISGGRLVSSGNTALANPLISTPVRLTRTSGNAFSWNVFLNSGISTANSFIVGFRTIAASPSGGDSIVFHSSTLSDNSVSLSSGESAFSNSVNYYATMVLRNAGCFYLIKGGVHTEWTLLWVSNSNTASLMYALGAGGTTTTSTYSLDNFLQFQLGGVWKTDYGIATNYIASPVSGETSSMESDGYVVFNWTPSAAQILDLQIRRTDDNNTWIVRCNQSTSTIKIIEKVVGVETERASAAVTFTVGTPINVQIKALSNTIRTFTNSTIRNTYASATFNQNATGMKVSGFTTGVNFASFPRILSGGALSEIKKYVGV